MFWTNFLLIACFVFVASASSCEELVARRCSVGAKVRSNFDSEEACTDAALKRCNVARDMNAAGDAPVFEQYPLASSTKETRQIPDACRVSSGYCDTVQFSIITNGNPEEISWQIIGPIGESFADLIEGGREKFTSEEPPALFQEIVNGVVMRVPNRYIYDTTDDDDSDGSYVDTDNSDGTYVLTEGEYWLTVLDSFGDAGFFFQLSIGGNTIFQDIGNFFLDTEFDIDWDHSVSKSFICEDRHDILYKGSCDQVTFTVETGNSPLDSGWILEGPIGLIQFDSYAAGEANQVHTEIANGVTARGAVGALTPGLYTITVIDRAGEGAAIPRLFFADQFPIQNVDFLTSYTRSISASFLCL